MYKNKDEQMASSVSANVSCCRERAETARAHTNVGVWKAERRGRERETCKKKKKNNRMKERRGRVEGGRMEEKKGEST